jgi:fructose-bisphosphate aldolase class II
MGHAGYNAFMKDLRTYLAEAKEKGVAMGHFNFSNLEGLWAIFNAAHAVGAPVIVGASEGERDFVGVKQAVALVKSLREEFDFPIFINADHTYSALRVEEAARAGFDAVIFDGAKLGIEENIAKTKEAVAHARAANPNILVEAELGYIGQSSQVLKEVPAGAALTDEAMTTPADAKRFVEETGVDLFAPAVGNVHGIIVAPNYTERLNVERIKEIHQAIPNTHLVLHGGSGLPAEDFIEGIKAGISLVHISTELRVAFRDALSGALTQMPDEKAPYKYLGPARNAMQKAVEEKLALFNARI